MSSRQSDHAIRSLVCLTLVIAIISLVACSGGGGKRAAPSTTAPTTTSLPPASSPSPSTTATSQCTNAQIISAWPLERRAAQLVVIPSLNFNVTALKTTVAAGVGGILFLGNAPAPADLARVVAQMSQPAPGGVAPMTMADEEGGGIQRMTGAVDDFPWPRQMAATMTPGQITATAARVGRQLRQAGVDMDLAPVLDIDGGNGPNSTDADGQRSFSADPTTAAQDGIAFLDGLRQSGVIPVVKHFPGLGGRSATPTTVRHPHPPSPSCGPGPFGRSRPPSRPAPLR